MSKTTWEELKGIVIAILNAQRSENMSNLSVFLIFLTKSDAFKD